MTVLGRPPRIPKNKEKMMGPCFRGRGNVKHQLTLRQTFSPEVTEAGDVVILKSVKVEEFGSSKKPVVALKAPE